MQSIPSLAKLSFDAFVYYLTLEGQDHSNLSLLKDKATSNIIGDLFQRLGTTDQAKHFEKYLIKNWTFFNGEDLETISNLYAKVYLKKHNIVYQDLPVDEYKEDSRTIEQRIQELSKQMIFLEDKMEKAKLKLKRFFVLAKFGHKLEKIDLIGGQSISLKFLEQIFAHCRFAKVWNFRGYDEKVYLLNGTKIIVDELPNVLTELSWSKWSISEGGNPHKVEITDPLLIKLSEKCSHLKVLNFSPVGCTIEGLNSLFKQLGASLTSLSFSFEKINPEIFKDVSFPHLKYLHLPTNKTGWCQERFRTLLAILEIAPSLTNVDIPDVGIFCSKEFLRLAQLGTNLKYLNIARSNLCNDLKYSFERLETLDISGCLCINIKLLLSGCPNLKELMINQIDKFEFETFEYLLLEMPHLKKFEFNEGSLRDWAWKGIVKKINYTSKFSSSLEEINNSWKNPISPHIESLLIKAFKMHSLKPPTIKHVFNDNQEAEAALDNIYQSQGFDWRTL